MNKAQKMKIKKAIKKAWKEGKYKNAFKSKSKAPKEEKELVFKMTREEINKILVFLENGERLLITCEPKTLVTVVERIQVAMNDYESLMLGGFATITKLNKEGTIIDVLNGRKIIGYSAYII